MYSVIEVIEGKAVLLVSWIFSAPLLLGDKSLVAIIESVKLNS